MKKRLEEKPVSSFPDTCGKRRGRGQVEVNPDGNVIRKGGGIMDPPVGE
jgi:hypothetical protein